MQKVKIEKNTVQKTLIVPLYGRKMCSEKFPELYMDVFAKELCERIDYDFTDLEKKNNSFLYEFGSLEAAMRQLDIMWEIKEYLKKYPEATVVNIDFPDIIEIRKKLIAEQNREKNIACDLKDYTWMKEIDDSKGVIFFAAGVFHYFKMDEVKALVLELAKRYTGGCLVFDSVGKLGLKLMMSKTLKNMGIKDVDGFFYINNLEKDLNWSKKIKVTSKGYMLGYYDMKSPNIHFTHRLLGKICDNVMKMSINKMEFE